MLSVRRGIYPEMPDFDVEHWADHSVYRVTVGAVEYEFRVPDMDSPREYNYAGEGEAPDHVVDALDEWLADDGEDHTDDEGGLDDHPIDSDT